MVCEIQKALACAGRWGPIGLLALAGGCVPDVPFASGGPDGGQPDGPEHARDGITGTPSARPGGPNMRTGDPAVPDNAAAPNGPGDPSEGNPAGRSAGGSIDPAAVEDTTMTAYHCQADSDCAESLVCRNEACVFEPPDRFPSSTVQTVGGGLVRGAGLRLQLRLGAPSPAGRMSGGGHQLTLGPLAGS